MPKALDLANKRFGRLVALYPLKERKNGKIIWHCQCDCGNVRDVVSTTLQRGLCLSCGCLQKEQASKANAYDIAGQKFNYLTAIERVPGGKWKCQCDCGNITYVQTTKLVNGLTKSCGCYQKQRISETSLKDLTNQRFGKLVVLERDPNFIKKVKWICKCDCGNIISCWGNNLSSGNVSSCGCEKKSHGEQKITQLLIDNNIPFETEYSFEDCINPKTGRRLRFDFFVNKKYLIEYDGIQHHISSNNIGWGENIEDIQYRDSIKDKYCKEHNIPLIRIPYTKYNTLTINDLLLQK